MKCNQPNCKGIDHQGQCWKCPHSRPVLAGEYKASDWKDTPCFLCRKDESKQDCDSREQGHGRVISYDEAPPLLVSTFTKCEENEELSEMRIASDILFRLLRLAPKEYVALIESVRYADNGGQRKLNHVKWLSNALFKENISFQIIKVRLDCALRKLKG